jgi:hypothetical protein
MVITIILISIIIIDLILMIIKIAILMEITYCQVFHLTLLAVVVIPLLHQKQEEISKHKDGEKRAIKIYKTIHLEGITERRESEIN